MSPDSYYNYALAIGVTTVLIGLVALTFSKRSAKNSERSADQAEKAHAAKYEITLSHNFQLKEYSFPNGGYATELVIKNGSEVPVKVQVKYVGRIDLFITQNPHMVDTTVRQATIKAGESAMVNIDILTGGLGGRAKLDIHCVASNSVNREKHLVLGQIDEILLARQSY